MSQEFDKNVLELAKQKGFYLYDFDFEEFKDKLPRKDKFYSSVTNKEISDNEYEIFLKSGINSYRKQ